MYFVIVILVFNFHLAIQIDIKYDSLLQIVSNSYCLYEELFTRCCEVTA
jgi:hypothetical protein